MKQKEPKFEIGQKVSLSSPTLYGETQGVIVERTRCYKVVARVYNGYSIPETNGLLHDERDIPSICLPYRFDGNTLEIDYPETNWGKACTMVSEFYGYSYSIKTAQMLSLYPERALREI